MRDIKYIIVRRNLIENIMDLEFKEPGSDGYFYAGIFVLTELSKQNKNELIKFLIS